MLSQEQLIDAVDAMIPGDSPHHSVDIVVMREYIA